MADPDLGAVGVQAVAEIWHSFTLPEHDLRPEAGKITAPTVLVWGWRDPVLPPRAGGAACRTTGFDRHYRTMLHFYRTKLYMKEATS